MICERLSRALELNAFIVRKQDVDVFRPIALDHTADRSVKKGGLSVGLALLVAVSFLGAPSVGLNGWGTVAAKAAENDAAKALFEEGNTLYKSGQKEEGIKNSHKRNRG